MKKIHRFIGPYQLGQGMLRIDDAQLVQQMRLVLKLAPGELVLLGDGSGNETQCRIVRYDRDAVILEGLSLSKNQSELPIRITLYCAVLKADHFELVAQKATEIGVARIVPLITKRTVKLNLRQDRLERIVREAAELSGRGALPIVEVPMPFDRAFDDAAHNDDNYFFDSSGAAAITVAKSVRTAGVFVGPEGGWDEQELDEASKVGMRITSLGELMLRAETAAIIAPYLIAHPSHT